MARSEFTRKVKAQAFLRANGHCEGCTARLMPGRFHYDHVVPDGLGGEPVLSNAAVLCTACHAVKTGTEDVPRIAKMKRQRDSHIGARIRGRGFPKSPPQRTASRPLSRRGETT